MRRDRAVLCIEPSSKAWLIRPTVGQRLEDAFYHASDDATASRIAEAHEL